MPQNKKLKKITSIIIFFVFFANYAEKDIAPINITINTSSNKVGIKKNDTCQYVSQTNIVMCKSKKRFKDINIIIGSSTGTPPWLMYKNYIGYYLPESNKNKKLPGQARRVIFCKGKCEPINNL